MSAKARMVVVLEFETDEQFPQRWYDDAESYVWENLPDYIESLFRDYERTHSPSYRLVDHTTFRGSDFPGIVGEHERESKHAVSERHPHTLHGPRGVRS